MIIDIPNPLNLFRKPKLAAPITSPPPPPPNEAVPPIPSWARFAVLEPGQVFAPRAVITQPAPDSLGTIPNHAGMTPQAHADAPAKAEESSMATAPVTLQPAPVKKAGGFKSFMVHLLTFGMVTLKEAAVYLPSAAKMAEVLLPQYATMIAADQATATKVIAGLTNATVIIQQKYASATPSDETNAQKLADVIALEGDSAITTLNSIGIASDADHITNLVGALVGILKAQPAPAA